MSSPDKQGPEIEPVTSSITHPPTLSERTTGALQKVYRSALARTAIVVGGVYGLGDLACDRKELTPQQHTALKERALHFITTTELPFTDTQAKCETSYWKIAGIDTPFNSGVFLENGVASCEVEGKIQHSGNTFTTKARTECSLLTDDCKDTFVGDESKYKKTSSPQETSTALQRASVWTNTHEHQDAQCSSYTSRGDVVCSATSIANNQQTILLCSPNENDSKECRVPGSIPPNL